MKRFFVPKTTHVLHSDIDIHANIKMVKKEKYLVFPSVAFSAASRGCIAIQSLSSVNRSQNDSNLS